MIILVFIISTVIAFTFSTPIVIIIIIIIITIGMYREYTPVKCGL